MFMTNVGLFSHLSSYYKYLVMQNILPVSTAGMHTDEVPGPMNNAGRKQRQSLQESSLLQLGFLWISVIFVTGTERNQLTK